ncbi:MAG: GNAT family N-acetyltransferase [Nocardioidaceae bacterium]
MDPTPAASHPAPAFPSALGPGWSLDAAGPDDVADLVDLLGRQQAAHTGRASTTYADVAATVVGRGAAARSHVIVRDDRGAARGWAVVHDRAAGRVLVDVVVDPAADHHTADMLATLLFRWAEDESVAIARDRGLAETQIDSGAYAGDTRQQRWLAEEGFNRTRSWWQMSRPVVPSEGAAEAFPPPKEGVTIRRVRRGPDGLPDQSDLRTVHDILETSFADHFNSYAEAFDEFVSRLREDPGHRWDHWWIAEVDTDTDVKAAGALVASAIPGSPGDDEPQPSGSYVDYIGVLQTARGGGVASALLHAVIADAAQRGRNRVGLEVDTDSPTGAGGLYASMGWETSYVTESWHRDIPVHRGSP